VFWGDVRVLLRREVRGALRERSVVVNSILLPVVLYPLLIWIEISALGFVTGLAERSTARVALLDDTSGRSEIVEALRGGTEDGAPDDDEGPIEIVDTETTLDQALARLAAGDLDAIVTLEEPTERGVALEGNARVVVRYDRSVDRSRRALERIERVVDESRAARLAREADRLDFPPGAAEPLRVTRRNVSTEEALGTTLLGMMIPLFLVVAVALGCLVPAVDATAGERERGTWETLMTTRASRGSIVTAKYLYVASFGATAGVLNVAAMSVSLGPILAPLQGAGDGGPALVVSLAPTAIVVMALGAVLLALFFAAAMMPLAAFAHTFKDGQALVTPVFYLALIPLVLGQQTDRTLTPAVAMIPVANIAMAVRDAIHGVFIWPLLGLTAAVSVALILTFITFSRWILGFEDFLIGSHAVRPWRFVRDKLGSAR
jgi:sodium transport system permease protein